MSNIPVVWGAPLLEVLEFAGKKVYTTSSELVYT